jgi:protein ImuB
MPRVMTIWLPRWPVQRRLLEHPEWRPLPVFVCRREGRGAMRVVSWLWSQAMHQSRHRAERQAVVETPVRIPEGTSLAEAMAMLSLAHGSRACHAAIVEHDDPLADRLALEKLARWCRRFAPIVALETPPQPDGHPECLMVDVTNTADFFGGEESLARTAAWTLAARGIHARVAIADTPGAAWAAAHFTHRVAGCEIRSEKRPVNVNVATAARDAWRRRPRRWAVVPTATLQPLAHLPAAALRLDDRTLAALDEVGVESIGDVLRLPRKSLVSRFGQVLARRLAEFSGSRAEPLEPPADAELPHAAHDFEVPVSVREGGEALLLPLVERLVGRCVAEVAAHGKGITSLQVRLDPGRAGDATRQPTAPVVIDIGVFRPSGSTKHLVDLVRLRLARLRLPQEIESVVVEVITVAAADCRQRVLFSGIDGEAADDAQLQVAMLLDRLAGRLGRGAVFEPRPVADAQPEHAWVAVPAGLRSPTASAGLASRRGGRSAADRVGGHGIAPARLSPAGRRPVWMLPRPVPLETVSVMPVAGGRLSPGDSGPPLRFRWNCETHQVARAHGPERIETAWWRGPCVRRDYYVVETQTGGRYWLFRRLRDGAWFLHGMFA